MSGSTRKVTRSNMLATIVVGETMMIKMDEPKAAFENSSTCIITSRELRPAAPVQTEEFEGFWLCCISLKESTPVLSKKLFPQVKFILKMTIRARKKSSG